MADLEARIPRIRTEILAQSERVYDLVLRAVDVAFDLDADRASAIEPDDETIDKADVAIEKMCVEALCLEHKSEYDVRSLVAITKINNELERIADRAVDISRVVSEYGDDFSETPPPTFRVMANSVIGIIRDANRALEELNVDLARQVLGFDETVASFKDEIGLDAERKVADGEFSVSFAFRLRSIVAQLERMADHATNICEQLIYLESGKTLVSRGGRWTDAAAEG